MTTAPEPEIDRCAHCGWLSQLTGSCRHGRLCETCRRALEALNAEAQAEP